MSRLTAIRLPDRSRRITLGAMAASVALCICTAARAAEPPLCCQSPYYCRDPRRQARACDDQFEQPFPPPFVCNTENSRCEIPAVGPPPCAGDCDRNAQVTIDELVRGITIALGSEPARACWALQADDEPSVRIDELVRAVRAALDGCAPPGSSCGAAPPRYAGPLCGPASNPCTILSDEQVPVRGTVSALSLDNDDRPYLLLRDDDGRGHVAHRADSGWSSEPVPFDGFGSLFAAADGTLSAVVYAPPTSTALWVRDTDAWTMIEQNDRVLFSASDMARDDAGCLHGIGFTPENVEEGVLAYALRTDHWGFSEAVGGFREPLGYSAIALAPNGTPHLAYWGVDYGGPDGGGWVVRSATPPELPETVARLGSHGLEDFPIRLVVTANSDIPGGQLHLFFNRLFGDTSVFGSSGTELVYAVRAADGTWAVRSIDRGTPNEFVFERCGPPPALGRTCFYRYESVRPIAAVASGGGDVRLFYSQYTVSADLRADCPDGVGPPYCSWVGPTETVGTVEVAWPDGDQLRHATVLSDVPPPSGQVAVDRHGVFHLALAASGVVRYVRLGSADELVAP